MLQMLVEAEAKSRVARALDEADLEHSVEVEDVLELVKQEKEHMQEKKRRKRAAGKGNRNKDNKDKFRFTIPFSDTIES